MEGHCHFAWEASENAQIRCGTATCSPPLTWLLARAPACQDAGAMAPSLYDCRCVLSSGSQPGQAIISTPCAAASHVRSKRCGGGRRFYEPSAAASRDVVTTARIVARAAHACQCMQSCIGRRASLIVLGCTVGPPPCSVQSANQPDYGTSQADKNAWQGHQAYRKRNELSDVCVPSLLQTRKLRTMPMLTSRLEETVSRHSSDCLGGKMYSTAVHEGLHVYINCTACTARKKWGAHHRHKKP